MFIRSYTSVSIYLHLFHGRPVKWLYPLKANSIGSAYIWCWWYALPNATQIPSPNWAEYRVLLVLLTWELWDLEEIFALSVFTQCLHILRCYTEVVNMYSQWWEMLWFSKWAERVLKFSQLERKELISNQSRTTNKSHKYAFESIENAIPQTLPGWLIGILHPALFPASTLVLYDWLSGSQCGTICLWGKLCFLRMKDSERSVISLGYWGGNKNKLLKKIDSSWNDWRYRKETNIKLSSRESLTTVNWISQASCLPTPKSNH